MYPLSNAETSRPLPWAAMLLALLVFLSGCGDMEDFAPNSISSEEGDGDVGMLQEAEEALKDHRVDDARQHYADRLDDHPGDGRAAAGLGVTDLMLSAESSEVTQLLIDHLGASGGIDANTVLYDEDGFLYWASRGVKWADEGDQYQGIRSLLADDLPWDAERLETLTAFVDGHDEPTGEAIRQLVTIANALKGVDKNLETAIEDQDFMQLYVPGEVFHDSRLTLRLGRSELSLLRAAIAAFRGAIYFVAAYEHRWSLEGAFGDWRIDTDLSDDRHQPGFEPIDYTVDYLDGHIFRALSNPDRLSASRSALRNSLQYGRDAIHFGIEEPSSTTLEWQEVDETDAADLDELLKALSNALDGAVELPHSSPQTTLDLSPFFDEDGRVLDEDIPWFVKNPSLDSEDDEFDDSMDRWTINEDALDQFWRNGILEPPPRDSEDMSVDLGPDDGYFAVLAGSYWENFTDVYFATR